MKNIHLLPTDKPSRLHLWTDENGTRPALCELEYSHTRNTQNIYITSDEEIKEGDYYLDFRSDGIKVEHFKTKDDWVLVGICGSKRIILTTDKSLDGVQKIADDFLEWFVKNPSCEEVEFELDYDTDERIINGKNLGYYSYIIPKEEPKQEEIDFYAKELMLEKERAYKQETLEEAAEIDLTRLCYYDRRNPDFQIKEEYGYDKEEVEATGNFAKKDCACDNCFYGRSKLTEQLLWQQKRSYSEEDMFEFSQWISDEDWVYLPSKGYWVNEEQEELEQKLNSKEILNMWFEQFKKK